MADKTDLKCLIMSKDGCIIQDETVIVLAVTTAVAVTLALPLLGVLLALSPKPPS